MPYFAIRNNVLPKLNGPLNKIKKKRLKSITGLTYLTIKSRINVK